jgi:uncharacterized RDD family membrane protein YckC
MSANRANRRFPQSTVRSATPPLDDCRSLVSLPVGSKGSVGVTEVMGGDPTRCVWRRFFAWLVDGTIDAVVYIGLLQLLGIDITRERSTGTAFDLSAEGEPGAYGAFVFVVVFWFAVRAVLVGKLGWSPGKFVLGLRVVRWDGRPPGIGRALSRSLVFSVAQGIFGCLYWGVGLFSMMQSRGHRQPADFVAGTYVIDNFYAGRLLLDGPGGLTAGPASVTRDEAERYFEHQGFSEAVVPQLVPPGPKSTKPFYDKTRDTHVVWRERQQEWLQFDKKENRWVALRCHPQR